MAIANFFRDNFFSFIEAGIFSFALVHLLYNGSHKICIFGGHSFIILLLGLL